MSTVFPSILAAPFLLFLCSPLSSFCSLFSPFSFLARFLSLQSHGRSALKTSLGCSKRPHCLSYAAFVALAYIFGIPIIGYMTAMPLRRSSSPRLTQDSPQCFEQKTDNELAIITLFNASLGINARYNPHLVMGCTAKDSFKISQGIMTDTTIKCASSVTLPSEISSGRIHLWCINAFEVQIRLKSCKKVEQT